ncbi:MAG: hypothetical protein K2L62_05060, partial [Muribaculaceae bacterium]|nr:hypothetical protein [Muribaculaceae bacterium]
HEWPEFGSFNYCDEYLYEAATIPASPSGTTYDPERDGTTLRKPLGLLEHWGHDRKHSVLDLRYRRMD